MKALVVSKNGWSRVDAALVHRDLIAVGIKNPGKTLPITFRTMLEIDLLCRLTTTATASNFLIWEADEIVFTTMVRLGLALSYHVISDEYYAKLAAISSEYADLKTQIENNTEQQRVNIIEYVKENLA